MYKLQANQIRGLLEMNTSVGLDLLGQMLTGCGPLDHDTDGETFSIYGYSDPTTGVGDSDWHAILDVWQQNLRAGTAQQPKLLSARFRGPVRFDSRLFGSFRLATATANWNSATSTVTATDNETSAAIVDAAGTAGVNLYSGSNFLQPNVRNGDVFAYWYDVDGTPRAHSVDLPIGCQINVNATSLIKGGWQVADGTNGTMNLVGRYPLGHATVAGTLGGSGTTGSGTASITMSGALETVAQTITMGGSTGTHSITLSGSVTANTISLAAMTSDTNSGVTTATDGSGTTGDESAHTHGITFTLSALGSLGVSDVVSSVDTPSDTGSAHSHTTPAHSHTVNSFSVAFTGATAVGSHTHTDSFALTGGGAHSHTGASLTATTPNHTHGLNTLAATDAGHTHPFTPLNCTVIPIQRVS